MMKTSGYLAARIRDLFVISVTNMYGCIDLSKHMKRKFTTLLLGYRKKQSKERRILKDYISMLFKLILDQRNLNEAVDIREGERCTRFTKYEPHIYHKTGKTKYTIVSIHLTALVSGLLLPNWVSNCKPFCECTRRCQLQLYCFWWICSIQKAKLFAAGTTRWKMETILRHSKEYPFPVEMTKHVEKSAVQMNGKVSTICHHTNLMCNLSWGTCWKEMLSRVRGNQT